MTITEYFSKLKAVTDELALAGSLVTNLDFITHLISGLEQPYYPMVVYIEANMLKMSINEAYSMFLTHEARIKSNQLSASKEAKMNFIANVTQTGHSNKKPGNNTSGGYNNWNQNTNWNGNNNGKGGYNNSGGRGGFGRDFPGQGRGKWNNGPSGRGG